MERPVECLYSINPLPERGVVLESGSGRAIPPQAQGERLRGVTLRYLECFKGQHDF